MLSAFVVDHVPLQYEIRRETPQNINLNHVNEVLIAMHSHRLSYLDTVGRTHHQTEEARPLCHFLTRRAHDRCHNPARSHSEQRIRGFGDWKNHQHSLDLVLVPHRAVHM